MSRCRENRGPQMNTAPKLVRAKTLTGFGDTDIRVELKKYRRNRRAFGHTDCCADAVASQTAGKNASMHSYLLEFRFAKLAN
jgi:hypothetical protein